MPKSVALGFCNRICRCATVVAAVEAGAVLGFLFADVEAGRCDIVRHRVFVVDYERADRELQKTCATD
jgi:hypothetical protein